MSNKIEKVERINAEKIVNLTPHEIAIADAQGNIIAKIPPSGLVARVDSKEEVIAEINGIPVCRVTYGNIVGLPEPKPGTIYVVSLVVLSALKEKGITRTDVVSPNTNPSSAVRDASGKIIAVKSFMVL